MYLFGRENTFNVYLWADTDRVSTIPTQTVTAYVFRDNPSREQASAGTDAVETVSHSHVSNNFISLTIPAIDDPYPNGTDPYEDYYIAVKFKLNTSEQTQIVIRRYRLEKAVAKDELIGVTKDRVEAIFPEIYKYLSEAELQSIIDLAQFNVMSDLKRDGYKWSMINRPSELFDLLFLRVLKSVYASQVQRQGDRFVFNFEQAKEDYANALSNLRLDLSDETSNGVEVAEAKSKATISLWR